MNAFVDINKEVLEKLFGLLFEISKRIDSNTKSSNTFKALEDFALQIVA